MTDFYYPNDEGGLMYNDPDLGIEWPLEEYGLTEADIILSERIRGIRGLRSIAMKDIRRISKLV